MITLSPGQLLALKGIACFVLEEYQELLYTQQPLPHISEMMESFLVTLNIPQNEWREACMIVQMEMNFLADECQEQQQN